MKISRFLLVVIALSLPMVASAEYVYLEFDGIWYQKVYGSTSDELSVAVPGGYSQNYGGYSGDIVIPEVVWGYRVTGIAQEAFKYCTELSSIFIPNSVKGIGSDAFYGCSSLTSIVIPNSVKYIGSGAFSGCSSLTSITFPDNWFSLYYTALIGSAWYDNQPDGVVYAGNVLYRYKGNVPSESQIEIKEGTLGINQYAFSEQNGLKTIVIPNSVTTIGEEVFRNCNALTSVTIGNSVTSMGKSAFEGCSGLTSVHISDIAAWCKITFAHDIEYVFPYDDEPYCFEYYSYKSNPLIYAHHLYLGEEEIKDLVFPTSVTSIGEGAFYGCSGLTSVTIPISVTSIGSYTFSGCSGLTSVTIPNSMTSIESNAFSGCSNLNTYKVPVTDYSAFCTNKALGCIYSSLGKPVQLIDAEGKEITEFVVPDGVFSIGKEAFCNCTGLTAILIAGSVTSIGNFAFWGCTSIMSVRSNIAEPFDVQGLFSSETYRNGTLYVPVGTKDLYIRFDGWRQFLKIEEMGGTTGIKNVQQTAGNNKYYNLSGLHVENPGKGLYIQNGKKVEIK